MKKDRDLYQMLEDFLGACAVAALLLISGCTAATTPEAPQSSAKALTAFGFANPAVAGTINEAAHTVALSVPYGTTVTALAGTFTSTGASVQVGGTTQVSGVTTNDFTSPVTYTVTSADGSSQAYTVTVTVLGKVSVGFSWGSYQSLSFSSSQVELLLGSSVTLSPTFASGGTNWAWMVNGTQAGSASIYTFTPSQRGLHNISVTVKNDGVLYSGSVTVTVN